jgi:two-component system response regulator YesN
LTGLLGELIVSVYGNKNDESQIIYEVKNYINHHFSEDITLKGIAKLVYMNPYYFSTFFKRKTGRNFKSYLTEVRMKQAFILLEHEDIKTEALANAVGYKDVRTFTEKFKETYGSSPVGLKKQGHL